MFDHHITLGYASREGARVGSALANGGGQLGCGAGRSPNADLVDPQVIAAVQRVLTSPGSLITLGDDHRDPDLQGRRRGRAARHERERLGLQQGQRPVDRRHGARLRPGRGTGWQACSRSNIDPPDLDRRERHPHLPPLERARLDPALLRWPRSGPDPHVRRHRHGPQPDQHLRWGGRCPLPPDPPDQGRPTGGLPAVRSIVIFTLSIFLFVGMCAVVVDAAWYWANNLRIQRAADAAALAGVVWLPGDATTAVRVAREEATKNGYTSGIGGYTVTPRQDPDNPRRMMGQHPRPGPDVLREPVRTCRPSTPPGISKAEYVLPVPMGSPQNYYGVGFYEQRVPTVAASPASMVFQAPSNEAGGGWSGASKAAEKRTTRTTATRRRRSDERVADNGATSGCWTAGTPCPTTDPGHRPDRGRAARSERGRERRSDGCMRAHAEISWDGGGSWSSSISTAPLGDDAPRRSRIGRSAARRHHSRMGCPHMGPQ